MHRPTADDPDLAGCPVEAAVDVVRDHREDADRETVRAVLDTVTEDGVVTEAAVEDAVAHVSKVVATPETRVELAARALEDARESAGPVDDVAVVAARLDGFEARLAGLRERLGEHRADLRAVTDGGDLFAVAAAVERLRTAANETQAAADQLSMDVDEFETWLERPAVRYRELRDDASALEDAVDELAATVEETEATDRAGAADDGPAQRWAVARMRHLALSLMLADLRTELEGLVTLDERAGEGTTEDRRNCRSRLDAADSRLAALDERLDAVAEPAFERRHGDRVAAFEAAAASFEPPVDWAAVRQLFEQHCSAL